MSTYRFIVLTLLTLCINLDVIAHQKPHIINFTRDKYHASNKNWSIGQDEKGIMYFGNDTGLLESDGMEWNLYSVPNKSFIKALCVETHNQIYTGGLEDFGVWNRTKSGKLSYTSLKGLLPANSLDNESFWRIWIDKNNVYFQSFTNIYVYNHQTIERLSNSIGFLLLNQVNDEFWVQEMYGSLFQIKDGQLNKMKGSEFLNGTLTRVILPFQNGQYLLGTSAGELYLYNRKNFIPWNNNLSRQLSGKELNCGIYCSKRNSYYLGTLLDGIYEVNTEGEILNHFAAPNSLQNNTILALYEDYQHNIWVAMDHGLAYIRYTDGLSYYHTTERNSLAIYDAALWNDLLLLGTNQGVYYTPQNKLHQFDMFSSLKLIQGTEGQVWSFKQVGKKLFCCHNNGLLEICSDFSIRQPYRIGCGVFRLMEQTINKQPIYLCTTYKELHIINPQNKEVIRINYPTEQINNAEFDHVGNIWLETVNRGIYKCKLADDLQSFRYSTYYGYEKDTNLPTHLQVCSASGRIFFLGDDRFFTYNESENDLQPDPLLNQCFDNIQDIKRIIPINNEESWAITSSSVYRFYYDGYLARIKESYKIEADNLSLITASENISILNDTLSLICLDAGFILHNSKYSQKQIIPLEAPNLKYIQTGGNHTNFLDYEKEIKIPFKDNTITTGFFVSNAFIGNLAVEYKMDKVDSTWSEPRRKNSVSYARLPHGKYKLHLRSTDGTNNYSPITTVNFEILPPWYETIWWYMTCICLIASALFTSYWIMKKRWHTQHIKRLKAQENEQLRMLNERLQHEIDAKNAELFTQTSFIIHKNELILKLKAIVDEISLINTQKSIMPLTRKINVLLTDNLNTEDDWKMFLIKFEQKHHNFFKTLKEHYPVLTNNDLRLCACLKLNMETKDIASLMNLSVRAVENNRYRLRKKLDLKPTQNLNEFFLLIE